MRDDNPSSHPEEAGSARERFVADLQSISSHAQELLEVTHAVSGEGIAAAREQLKESLRVAGEHLKQLQCDAVERSRKAAEQADSYVHEKPWQAIGMGMVAGLAIGFASSSMMRGVSARA